MNSIAFDGILGLGPLLLSHTGTSVFQQMYLQAGITAFSLVLTRYVEGSRLVFGEPPSLWYEPDTLVYTPVSSMLWWELPATMWIGGEMVHGDHFILDSGTSFLTAPRHVYWHFLDKVLPPGSRNLCVADPITFVLVCPCRLTSGIRPVEIKFGGQIFPIPAQELFSPLSTAEDSCVLEVQPVGDGSPVILGDTFLRTVVAIFDAADPAGLRIGLAKRSSEAPPGGMPSRVLELRLSSSLMLLVSFACFAMEGMRLFREWQEHNVRHSDFFSRISSEAFLQRDLTDRYVSP